MPFHRDIAIKLCFWSVTNNNKNSALFKSMKKKLELCMHFQIYIILLTTHLYSLFLLTILKKLITSLYSLVRSINKISNALKEDFSIKKEQKQHKESFIHTYSSQNVNK